MNKEKLISSARKAMMINTNIQISDNNTVEIDNCKKIIEYNDIYVKIRTSNLVIEIWGKNLFINDYNTDGIEVNGTITNLEISKSR